MATKHIKREKDGRRLSKPQHNAELLRSAMGPIHVLSVGISDYSQVPGYANLEACVEDAKAVADCFATVPELHSRQEFVRTIYGAKLKGSRMPPTRGTILRELQALANRVSKDERLLFYFSGHGDVLATTETTPQPCLVTSDTYSKEDPSAFVLFKDVKRILSESQAKQKFIILDVCGVGVDTRHFKALDHKQSFSAFVEQIGRTEGLAVLTSSRAGEKSLARSPSRLSLMTHFLTLALTGETKALDANARLTLWSLYDYLCQEVTSESKKAQHKQVPTLSSDTSGVIVLGDFSPETRNPDSLDFDGFELTRLCLVAYDYPRPSDIATLARSPHRQAPQFLLKLANGDMERLVAHRLKEGFAAYRNHYNNLKPMEHAENEVLFDQGRIEVTASLEADQVRLEYAVEFHDPAWWREDNQPQEFLRDLDLAPRLFRFSHRPTDQEALSQALAAHGWNYEPTDDESTSMRLDAYRLKVFPDHVDYEFGEVLDILDKRTSPAAISLAKTMTIVYRVLRQHKALL